ncbi:MAG: GatB/YqeY domain-containing protein, partial [Deltaproteobacteria bacterium]
LKAAQKAKDKIRLTVIRMLKTVIKNREVEKRDELTEQELLQAVNSQVKSRKESIVEYKKGDRQDLVKKEEDELEVLKEYLPEELTEEELREIIEAAVTEAEAAGPKDMGKVMKIVTAKTTGRADGKVVSGMVKEKLSSL